MDGILIINKPKNYTSHDIVRKVKKICNEKVGHTGTLDPLATGVLPILIGKGTLCSKYLIEHDKIYEVSLKLGIKTDTADSEGNVIEEKEVAQEILEESNIESTLKSFLGKQEQIPPMYSAIKVNGKKLYEYARKGQTVEVKPRTIEIYEIELLEINQKEKQIRFKVHCSKGTYIRSLCEDIAKKLNTIGYMSDLNRLQVGDFKIEDSITIEELEKKSDNRIISLENIFKEKERIDLDTRKYSLLLNGVRLTYKKDDGIYRIYHNEKFIGTGVIKNQLLKRDIII